MTEIWTLTHEICVHMWEYIWMRFFFYGFFYEVFFFCQNMTEIWTLTHEICVHMREYIWMRCFLFGGEVTAVPIFYFLNMVALIYTHDFIINKNNIYTINSLLTTTISTIIAYDWNVVGWSILNISATICQSYISSLFNKNIPYCSSLNRIQIFWSNW
jgi:hypothetical protein